MSEGFNVNAFLSATTDAPMSTQPMKAPAGKYRARVANPESPDDVATKWFQAPSGARTWWKLAIPFEIIDETLLASMNRKQPLRVVSDWTLDIDSATNAPTTAPGKNIDLGRLRAALGQNAPGVPWSFSQLFGAGPVMVEIVHRKNPKDESDPFVNVKRVEPATA